RPQWRTTTSANRRSRSDTLDRRLRLLEEAAGTPAALPGGVDLALLAQIADEVPVQRRLVLRAEVGEARAEREVHGAADLLVEERVLREPVDLVVQSEGDLPEPTRASIHREQRVEVLAAARGLGLDDRSALEAEPDARNLPAMEERREGEADLALGDRLQRAREDLAVGHVVAAVRGVPTPAFDADAQVGPGPDDPQLARLGELVGAGGELRAQARPVRDGIPGLLDVAGPVDKPLVLRERHLRVLRVRLRRGEHPQPRELAARDPRPADLRELLARGQVALVAVRVGVRERTRVRLGPDRHERVELAELGLRDRRDELQLLVTRLGHEELRQALELEVDGRVRPGRKRCAVDLDRERRRDGRCVDAQHLPRLEAQRVRDGELGEASDARVAHLRVPTTKGRLTRTLTRFEFIVALIRIA